LSFGGSWGGEGQAARAGVSCSLPMHPAGVVHEEEGAVQLKPNSITLASSELAPNMFGASSELASVMEFGF